MIDELSMVSQLRDIRATYRETVESLIRSVKGYRDLYESEKARADRLQARLEAMRDKLKRATS
jgi:hypothetical protein